MRSRGAAVCLQIGTGVENADDRRSEKSRGQIGASLELGAFPARLFRKCGASLPAIERIPKRCVMAYR